MTPFSRDLNSVPSDAVAMVINEMNACRLAFDRPERIGAIDDLTTQALIAEFWLKYNSYTNSEFTYTDRPKAYFKITREEIYAYWTATGV